jgi:hypothetical protein
LESVEDSFDEMIGTDDGFGADIIKARAQFQ